MEGVTADAGAGDEKKLLDRIHFADCRRDDEHDSVTVPREVAVVTFSSG
jgi:hypothetical protein